jgi:hypothetical protein
MPTNRLITRLAADLRPVPRAARRLAIAMILGCLLAVAGLAMVFGAPLQAIATTGIPAFAMKLGYSSAVAAIAAMAMLAAGRPGDLVGRRLATLALPLLIVAAVAALELSTAAPNSRGELLLGSAYTHCVAAVALGAIPAFLLLTWGFRLLAPTNLTLAGFLIGLTSGATGAVAFALYCPEVSASFLISAYTPAMLAVGLIGAAAGPRLLRW